MLNYSVAELRKKHYTSKRVEELQVILNEIDW